MQKSAAQAAGLEEHRQQICASEPRLRLNPTACLPMRSSLAECQRCASACPVSALQVTEQGPRLSGNCLGCGRCAAACPSDALAVHGFPPLPPPPHSGPVVRAIDCWRVPASESDGDTLRLPCLGGLHAAQLLTLNRLCDGRGVALLDRGWCDTCPAGSGGHPAREAVAEARRILDALGIAPQAQPRIEVRPLPQDLALAEIPDSRLSAGVSRRGLFRRLAAEAMSLKQTAAGVAPPPNPAPNGGKILAHRRRRLYAELAMLGDTGQSAPSLPQIRVSDACQGHGICAALCPTGALERHRGEELSLLRIDARLCIGCGLCERACPDGALRLLSLHGGLAQRELRRQSQRRCIDCARPFIAPKPSMPRCPSCRRSQALLHGTFGGPPDDPSQVHTQSDR